MSDGGSSGSGLRRVPTGVPALDDLLGGGIPLYSVVLLAGEPGSGKTILSQQLLFRNAAAGRKGLYLTTLSESPLKATRFQSQFGFFQPEMFGRSVVYMDIGETIRSQELGPAVEVIGAALREHEPQVVVIDSFKAIHDLASSPREARTFTYDLAIELSAVQATTILVGEYELADIGRLPEFAVADGIVWLTLERTAVGGQRTLRVLKMRGIDHPTAPFDFEISRDGIALFALPRSVYEPRPHVELAGAGRVETGVPGLDALLRGGLPVGSQLLVAGEAGTGKTTLCLQYLVHGARELGEPGIYFSYEQTAAQLVATAACFGWDLQPLIERGLLRLVTTPLSRLNADKEVLRVEQQVRESGARRVVLDSLTALLHGLGQPDQIQKRLFALSTLLGRAGCTTLFAIDPPAGSGRISRFGVEESILDGVLVLRIRHRERERERTFEVHKLRNVGHAVGENLMRIGGEGVRVFPRTEEVVR